MVVAVVAVRMVQVALDEVIHMIAMRNRFVAAAGAVDVALGVAAAGVGRGAGSGILATDVDLVLLDLAARGMVQVAVVQVIDVPIVLDCGVATAGAMSM